MGGAQETHRADAAARAHMICTVDCPRRLTHKWVWWREETSATLIRCHRCVFVILHFGRAWVTKNCKLTLTT